MFEIIVDALERVEKKKTDKEGQSSVDWNDEMNKLKIEVQQINKDALKTTEDNLKSKL